MQVQCGVLIRLTFLHYITPDFLQPLSNSKEKKAAKNCQPLTLLGKLPWMFLIKVVLSLLYCFIRLDSGWGLVYCTAFKSGLGGGGQTFNTQEPHYWSRYSPHTMTLRKWWAEIRTWSRHYYGVNVRVYSSHLIAHCKAYGLAHCWREGLFTTKSKTIREKKRQFRTIKVLNMHV